MLIPAIAGCARSRTWTSRSRNSRLDALKAERATWERRVSLLRPESIDPDMLDERARVLLNYADPRELTLRLKQP
jgi:cell division protein FtsB